MKQKIKIQKVSAWCIRLSIALALLFIFILYQGEREFKNLRLTTDQYILCENAARQLEDGSNYLTEQVLLYSVTGEPQYMDRYFKEANEDQRREHALEELRQYFDGTELFSTLESAMERSNTLMETEYYSMRLMSEGTELPADSWPEEIRNTSLSADDEALSPNEKQKKAMTLISDDQYDQAHTEIISKVTSSIDDLTAVTKAAQRRATVIFSDTYLKIETGVVILILVLLSICLMMRKLIVAPLISYNESIKKGEIFPVIGADELQNLASTYNQVYLENQETQKLIRHQTEHDALTDTLNRGSFEKLLNIYNTGNSPFALILIDVDTFKSVNDTYGHAVGDTILKKVSGLLKSTFRSIDYVCRIGGDEFAIIMVEMTSDLKYTIHDKITSINEELGKSEDGIPTVSLSVGTAFSDRKDPGESIFKDADQALYYVKEHGRNGCSFYGDVHEV